MYVMQNGNLYTPKQLIGPYAASSAAASAAKRPSRAESRATPRWATPGELRKSVSLDLSQLC